jgi:hypothetical protein
MVAFLGKYKNRYVFMSLKDTSTATDITLCTNC